MWILPTTKKTLLIGLFSLTTGSTLAAKTVPYYVQGNEADTNIRPRQPVATTPSVALVGGGWDVAETFRWMIGRAGITPRTPGRFLVLRATGSDAYNPYIYSDLGTKDPTSPHENVGGKTLGVASAATLIVGSRTAADDAFVAEKIRNAHAIFIAGGNQADYQNYWAGTAMITALQEAINNGVPVGGTSAGAAILGEYAFVALGGTVTSTDALVDPFDRDVTINPLNTATRKNPSPTSLVSISSLANMIVDQHVNTRDRLGRLMSFVARTERSCTNGLEAPRTVIGVGLSEETALLISGDPSTDSVTAQMAVNPYNQSTVAPNYTPQYSAYFTKYTLDPITCKAGTALQANSLQIYRMSAVPSKPLHPANHSFMTDAVFNLSIGRWANGQPVGTFTDSSTLTGPMTLGADKGAVVRQPGMTHY